MIQWHRTFSTLALLSLLDACHGRRLDVGPSVKYCQNETVTAQNRHTPSPFSLRERELKGTPSEKRTQYAGLQELRRDASFYDSRLIWVADGQDFLMTRSLVIARPTSAAESRLQTSSLAVPTSSPCPGKNTWQLVTLKSKGESQLIVA